MPNTKLEPTARETILARWQDQRNSLKNWIAGLGAEATLSEALLEVDNIIAQLEVRDDPNPT